MKKFFTWLVGIVLAATVLGAPQLAAAHPASETLACMHAGLKADKITLSRARHLPVGWQATIGDQKVPFQKGDTYWARCTGPTMAQQLEAMTFERDQLRADNARQASNLRIATRDLTTARTANATLTADNKRLRGSNNLYTFLTLLMAALAVLFFVLYRRASYRARLAERELRKSAAPETTEEPAAQPQPEPAPHFEGRNDEPAARDHPDYGHDREAAPFGA